MRRDYFELDVSNIEWVETDADPEQPLVEIVFTGPSESLRKRLSDSEGVLLDASEIDVAFRLQEPMDDDPEAPGVVAVTNRITGEFIFELNETADDVLRFIKAARIYGESENGDGCYRVDIADEDDSIVEYEKRTFLVYDTDGNLLHEESLIPSGVEL